MNLTWRLDSSTVSNSATRVLRVLVTHPLHVGGVTGLSAAEIGHTHPGQILVPDLVDGLPAGPHAPHSRFDLPPAQVIELGQIEDHAKATDRKHEDEKHGFLRGSGHVALHLLDARVSITLVHGGHVESVQEILAHQKANFQSVSEHHLNDVKPGNALLPPPFGLGRFLARAVHFFGLQTVGLGFFGGVLRVLQYSVHDGVLDLLVLGLLSFQGILLLIIQREEDGCGGVTSLLLLGRLMDRVCDEAETRRTDHYDLENPISDVRYGERFVIACLDAARLQGVTDKHGLLIIIHGLSHYSYN